MAMCEVFNVITHNKEKRCIVAIIITRRSVNKWLTEWLCMMSLVYPPPLFFVLMCNANYKLYIFKNEVLLFLCGRWLFCDGFGTQRAVYVLYPKLLILMMPHTYIRSYVVLYVCDTSMAHFVLLSVDSY